ncbi:MAG: IS66 family transposase [Deltaproteobacteria bacterium]|nr:IS66 family transposase [Myxococcales bacterium]MDP3215135.1 IS66 family transposase [Deltaproteobacteria bacterium]
MQGDEAIVIVALLQGHIAAQEVLLAARDATIRDLRVELERKAFELARLQKIVFGDRRERVDPEALVLPGVDLAPSNDTTPEEPVAKRRVKAHERDVVSRRRRARLALDPACVTEKHVYLDPERTTCACCGEALAVIGEERREVTEREPARYLRIVTHRRKMACAGCKQGGVQIAPAEEPPATGAGGVGASLAVDIAVMHYADHLPFHRMAGIFLREGLTIDRSTLARVAARVSDALRPVVDRMERELLGSDAVLGIDGTGVKILARPHCARRTVYVRHGAGHVVYRALRAADAPSVLEGMEGLGGVVVGDAATVHTGTVAASMRIDLALCNAHARRGFYDARGTDRARADVALAFYREVAIEERRTAAMDPLARRGERERVLGPHFERFHAWLVEERPKLGPRSPMAEAFDYALRHWKGLTRFLQDGRVPWTNNESERLLRHLVVGRKAWIFRGTFGGARRGCVLWSLTMSCRLHGLDPRRYLLDTLEALRTTSHGGLGALTPRAYAERMKALANAA